MKSRSGRTTGASSVHKYKVMHTQADVIFTHTDAQFWVKDLPMFESRLFCGLRANREREEGTQKVFDYV